MENYGAHPTVHSGIVDEDSDLYRCIETDLDDLFSVEFHMGNTDVFTGPKRTQEQSERVFIIFDRDFSQKYFNHEMYCECVDRCKDLSYTPLVSSPKFELWMLMHHKDADFQKPSFYPSYGHYISSELVKCGDLDAIPGSPSEKFISRERFETHYKHGISTAIRTSKDVSLFETGPEKLMDHAGTDLGGFIEDVVDTARL